MSGVFRKTWWRYYTKRKQMARRAVFTRAPKTRRVNLYSLENARVDLLSNESTFAELHSLENAHIDLRSLEE